MEWERTFLIGIPASRSVKRIFLCEDVDWRGRGQIWEIHRTLCAYSINRSPHGWFWSHFPPGIFTVCKKISDIYCTFFAYSINCNLHGLLSSQIKPCVFFYQIHKYIDIYKDLIHNMVVTFCLKYSNKQQISYVDHTLTTYSVTFVSYKDYGAGRI